VHVATATVGGDDLAEEKCATVAEARHQAAELMPGVRLRHGPRAVGNRGADEEADAVGAAQPLGVEAQVGGQGFVEDAQARVGRVGRLPLDRHLGQIAREQVVESDRRCGRAHVIDGTEGAVASTAVPWNSMLVRYPLVRPSHPLPHPLPCPVLTGTGV
jgi:hypothetical protein